MRSTRLARFGTGAACIALVAGVGAVGASGVAIADPAGSVTTFTAGAGSTTTSLFLSADDTLFASGYGDATLGNGTVQALVTTDDPLSAVVASLNLSALPGGAIGARAVAAGPIAGVLADTVLASIDNNTANFGCDASAQSVIQAYDVAPWNLRQTWTLPTGHCPGAMAVGPDGRVWFQQDEATQIGRLNLDDGSVSFVNFTGASQFSAGRVGVGLDGNMYFTAQLGSGAGLLVVGTGTAGTTLDDITEVPLPANSVAYDLVVAENGDVWILAGYSGVWVYRPSAGAFVARTAAFSPFIAKSIAQTSDGTMWVLAHDFNNTSRYYAYAPQFTPSTSVADINLSSYTSFDVTGSPVSAGFIVAGPEGQGTLYRSTGTNSIQRIGVTVAPQIVSIDPPQGYTPGGSQSVISGTGLNDVTSVTIGGSAATIDASTATTLTVTVPPGTAGAKDVVVTSANGTNTLANGFTYVAPTQPPVPTLDAAIGGPGSITLQWTYSGTGGSPITDVEYAMDPYPGDWVSLGTTTSPVTISRDNKGNPLVPGQIYPVFIRARNALGPSNNSNTVNATPTDPTPPVTNPPGPPTDVVSVAGDGRAFVSWIPPVNEGSFAITDYRVVSSPGGATCLAKAPATTCTVERLTNGDTYTFTVQALNGAGWGASSESSNAVTPDGPKPTPTMMVTGSRGTGAKADRVFADGVTTHLVGRQVQARVHLSGQVNYENGSVRTVASDGTFTWQRRTKKTVYVYFRVTDDPGVRSNRLIIRLNRP